MIPPGTDTSRFAPPGKKPIAPGVAAMVDRFFTQPKKPLLLAICRPEVRKNLGRLVTAFGESPRLRELANLAIVAGQREDIRALDEDQAKVLNDLLLEVDRQDLWGHVALPKHHQSDDIPQLYRLAAKRRGVFVNPALTGADRAVRPDPDRGGGQWTAGGRHLRRRPARHHQQL